MALIHSSRTAGNFALWVALTLLAGVLSAQDFQLLGITTSESGQPRIRYVASPEFYYILLSGDTLTNIQTARDLALGQGEIGEVSDPVAPENTVFYRVREVPLTTPLDTDRDSIDDVYELRRRPRLNPLDPFDARLDPDQDQRTTLEEYRSQTDPFAPERPLVPTINYPTNATASELVTFSGQGPTNTLIRIEGGAAYVTNRVSADGTFVAQVSLHRNRLNRLFVSAVDEFGQPSPLAPIDILQDSMPPELFIDFPTNGASLTTANTLVAGRVGDALSGFLGLQVSVNGQNAQVDVGIGPNGTYQRSQVPLVIGPNELTVSASDRLGNSITRRVTVTRMEPEGPTLLPISGDLQTTNIHQRLAEPLVVKVAQEGGAPVAGQRLTFQVTRSDGRLLPVDLNQLASDLTERPDYSTNGVMTLDIATDAAGLARVWWTMGTDAGHANNRVAVFATNLTGSVYFCASASALPASQINIGSGNNQRGETGGPAAEPLKVWVSDGNNPVAGIPVTFRVVEGGGSLVPIIAADGASPSGPGLRGSRPTGSITLRQVGRHEATGTIEVTVLTSITGHAEVDFTFGSQAGNQLVEADFVGNAGLPATFVAFGLKRVPGQPTTFAGLVLDNASQPLGGVYCELNVAGFTNGAYSDAQGRFAFADIPAGSGHLYVNGASATSLGAITVPTNSYPALHYTFALVPNAANSLPAPVLLPRLNTNNAQWYYGTNDLTVTCEGIEGLKMTIKANSMKHPGGQIVNERHPALVSLNQVHHDKIPMPMPDGASPPFAWTLQPGGATFNPDQPVQVEYPNMSGLAPGAAAYFLTFNHDTERFEIVASGHVVEDGSTIVTDPGAGLTISGWGCNCPPYSVTGECRRDPTEGTACDDGDPNTGNDRVQNGICRGDPLSQVVFQADVVDLPPPGSTYASGVDSQTIVVTLNENAVSPNLQTIENGFRITYRPATSELNPSGQNTITLEAYDRAVGFLRTPDSPGNPLVPNPSQWTFSTPE